MSATRVRNPDRMLQNRLRAYHRTTRSGTYGFLAALPLLLLYEFIMVTAGAGDVSQVRVGAEVWTKQLLTLVGVRGSLMLAAIVILLGTAIVWYERRKRLPPRSPRLPAP